MPYISRVVVTGAGGFIGHHLTKFLRRQGYWVRGVDIKLPRFEPTIANEFLILDLRQAENADKAVYNMDEVYALAADMGGMGFISSNHVQILTNNLSINLNTLKSTAKSSVYRYFFSSSACIYPQYKQLDTDVVPLKEADAYPAQPEDAYGWEKLITERLCEHVRQEKGAQIRVARFHNIFGPLGTYDGGREKAPAALCRKIAFAKLSNSFDENGYYHIPIWGDGKQTRSFCYIDDCVEGIYRLMQSDYNQPLNIGQDRLISINDLADLIASIAEVKIIKDHVVGPEGVRGRNSDNSLLKDVLKWSPKVSLEDGLKITYNWIFNELERRLLKCYTPI